MASPKTELVELPRWALLLRLVVLTIDVCVGLRPWQRLILPGIVFAKFAFPRLPDSRVSLLVIAAIECVVLTLVVRIILDVTRTNTQTSESPEERVAEALSSYLPSAFGKLVAGEIVIVSSAVRSVWNGFKTRQSEGHDYASASTFWGVPVLVLVSGPPDLILLHRIFSIKSGLVTALLIALDVWSVVWLYGIYVTMQERKHSVLGRTLTIHKGILKSARIPVELIENVGLIENQPSSDGAAAVRLTVPGAPRVVIDVSCPIAVKRLWGPDQLVRRVFVSSSDPVSFVSAIEDSRRVAIKDALRNQDEIHT